VKATAEQAHAGLRGVILGKAVYEQTVDLAGLIETYQGEEGADW
jgi:phosphoribosylformimino-5-aminoimidazole carboxamide ribonucleotide (ProFAR) isomerase